MFSKFQSLRLAPSLLGSKSGLQAFRWRQLNTLTCATAAAAGAGGFRGARPRADLSLLCLLPVRNRHHGQWLARSLLECRPDAGGGPHDRNNQGSVYGVNILI